MGWSYNSWKNNFYSANTKPENFLEEYCTHFNTVEVNSSFYRIPSIATLEKWKNQATKNFLFTIKAPKKITHEKTFRVNSDYIDNFFTNITHLNNKLGPILFQFPPRLKSNKIDILKDLISVLPNKHRYVFEVRHNSWFDDPFFKLLSENKIALVLGDSPWSNKIENITTNFAYFRWEGDRKQIKGTTGKTEKERSYDTKKWAEKIKLLLERIEVFGYFSKYYSGHPPTDAKQLLINLDKH